MQRPTVRSATSAVHPVPRDASFDRTLAFRSRPGEFISDRCRRYGTDLFETCLLLQKTTCMTGPRGTKPLCDSDKFIRQGATPRRVQKTPFGEGGVQVWIMRHTVIARRCSYRCRRMLGSGISPPRARAAGAP
jgi:hypothetical protein